jgi:MFS family permease
MNDKHAIWALAVAETLVWAGLFYSFPALFIRWEAEFGWSKPELTGALTLALLASAATSPLFGALIDRGRGPAVLTFSAIAGGAAMILLAFVETLWQFYLTWVIVGVAMGGCLYEPTFAFITRARGENATRAITIVSLVAGFAGTLAFPLGHTVSEFAGWRAAAVTFGLLVLVFAAPLIAFAARRFEPDDLRLDHAQSTGGKTHDFLRKPAFWLLAFGFMLLIVNHGVILNHLLPLLAERGISADAAVLTASMIGPMQVAGRIAMMVAQRFVSMTSIMLACFAGMAVATLLLIGAGAAPALLAGFVILQGASHGVMSIVRPAITRQVLGQANFGAISGAMAVPYISGSALAPFIGSLIWLFGGYDLVLPFIFLCAVAGGIAAGIATRRRARP